VNDAFLPGVLPESLWAEQSEPLYRPSNGTEVGVNGVLSTDKLGVTLEQRRKWLQRVEEGGESAAEIARRDDLVIGKIREHILTPDNLTEIARLVTEELNGHSEEYRAEMHSLKIEMAYATRRLERLYDAAETGKIPLDDLSPRIRELKDRVDKLESRKEQFDLLVAGHTAEVASREEVAECARELRNLLQSGSLTERKTFVRGFVKKIRITDDEARMSYTLPMLPRGMAEEAVPVLGIEQRGGR
jgi:site-specific DNA recombinase